MGIASSLFHAANEPKKQTLHRRITPTEEQFEEQQERWNALAEHLISDLSKRSGCAIRTWLQGSYKFGTQVRPARLGDEFDIDLGVYFQWRGSAEDGDYEPHELKGMVQQSLNDYAADEVIGVAEPPKPRCSRVRFEGDFHIDVPSYHLDASRDARMLATAEHGWEDSDPKALYLWFKKGFDDLERAKVRRQIRYVKCWAGLNFNEGDKRPSSTLLTVLVAEAYCQLDQDLAADDDILAAVLEGIIDRLEHDSHVRNPMNHDEVLSDRLGAEGADALLRKLMDFATTAKDAVASENIFVAADAWSAPFQHFFPLPEVGQLHKALGSGAQLPVLARVPEVEVCAVPRNNRNVQWNDTNKIDRIPRDCDIYFTVTNPEVVPHNASVEWMVRNEGDEAEYKNDLGHHAGYGLSAEEHSAYKGTHYMDCVVKQYGRMIGMHRIPVTITGGFMPRRNPVKRPAYVRLRGGR